MEQAGSGRCSSEAKCTIIADWKDRLSNKIRAPKQKRRDPERSRLLWFIESDYRDYVLALVVGHRLT